MDQMSLAVEEDFSPRKKQAQAAYYKAHRPSFVDSLTKAMAKELGPPKGSQVILRPSIIDSLRPSIGIESNFSQFSLGDETSQELVPVSPSPASGSWFSFPWTSREETDQRETTPSFTTLQDRRS